MNSESPRAPIRIESVHKTYDARGRIVTALVDVSLDIEPGEFVSLVGPSGCGKTTLLRIVAGLTLPTSGRVSLDGGANLGIVYQRPVLLPWRTVAANVRLPAEVRDGKPGADVDTSARELLHSVGLEGFEGALPSELSVGMQQRVALARALVTEPDILLMDEPFAALDAMTREQMGFLLHRVWRTHRRTTLFVTHSIPEAVYLSTRIVAMSARPGRITQVIPVTLPLPREPGLLSSPDFAQLAQVVRSAVWGEGSSESIVLEGVN